jgi:hypothetical protein
MVVMNKHVINGNVNLMNFHVITIQLVVNVYHQIGNVMVYNIVLMVLMKRNVKTHAKIMNFIVLHRNDVLALPGYAMVNVIVLMVKMKMFAVAIWTHNLNVPMVVALIEIKSVMVLLSVLIHQTNGIA